MEAMPGLFDNRFADYAPKEVARELLEEAFYLPGFLCKEKDTSLFEQLQKESSASSRHGCSQACHSPATSCSCRTRCCQPLRHFMRCWSIWQRFSICSLHAVW
ncbi:unnamed protein product [Effrenium voratum]|nr:unnamed protein product [Effrenium voratum]